MIRKTWLKPPKTNASVEVPPPPDNPYLAVFKSETSVQLEPFQVSVKVVKEVLNQ